uniref:Arrestin C-terminal-like domain-containing protein n=1 Tax=Nothobranchius kadleci TaxID=1051664 RepID=A0A1A8BI04_NOTKA
MSPIENLSLTCDSANNTFSEGDTIVGMLSFNLTKDTKVKGIFVKAKGDAHVQWSEGSGDDERSYSARKRYFKVKEYLVTEKAEGNVLSKGTHHFKFKMTIPEGNMPSSFKGAHGSIVYKLEAKISRKWRWSTTVEREINFLSKSIRHVCQIKCPQSGSVNKKLGVFSKKEVQMSASVNRDVCSPGDTLSAFAKICNSSSKSMRPKFSLQQRTVYRAGSSTNTTHNTLFKAVGDPIEPNSEITSTCQIEVPRTAIYSIDNCEILSVEYYVKVYLDISFAFDPEVVFPLHLSPRSAASEDLGSDVPCAGPSYSDFCPPAYPNCLNPGAAGPDACEYPAPDPALQVNMPSGFNDRWPTNPTPYGFVAAACESPLPPVVPYGAQQEPPSYMSLFPNNNDASDWGETEKIG